MNLTKEQVKQHLFEEVEYKDEGAKVWSTGILQGYDADHDYQYIVSGDYWGNCRLPKPKAKRLLTVKELWGKTLINDDGYSFIVTERKDDMILYPVMSDYESVEFLHQSKYRLADDSLTYENATSLEVEV